MVSALGTPEGIRTPDLLVRRGLFWLKPCIIVYEMLQYQADFIGIDAIARYFKSDGIISVGAKWTPKDAILFRTKLRYISLKIKFTRFQYFACRQ